MISIPIELDLSRGAQTLDTLPRPGVGKLFSTRAAVTKGRSHKGPHSKLPRLFQNYIFPQ